MDQSFFFVDNSGFGQNYTNELRKIAGNENATFQVLPIPENSLGERRAVSYDTRFGKGDTFVKDIQRITGKHGIFTIQEAEPIGPKAYLDVLVIAPCTGNTLAKLCNGITDSPVLMAAKAHIRNNKPLIISISTNDAMGMNFKNIGMLMNMKNIYFVPFYQDDPVKKPNSLIGKLSMIPETIEEALKGKQLQPVLCDK